MRVGWEGHFQSFPPREASPGIKSKPSLIQSRPCQRARAMSSSSRTHPSSGTSRTCPVTKVRHEPGLPRLLSGWSPGLLPLLAPQSALLGFRPKEVRFNTVQPHCRGILRSHPKTPGSGYLTWGPANLHANSAPPLTCSHRPAEGQGPWGLPDQGQSFLPGSLRAGPQGGYTPTQCSALERYSSTELREGTVPEAEPWLLVGEPEC